MASLDPPPGNLTDIVGWQPNPLTRGTADILTTCVVTLSLCIWSALHLNVPGDDGWYARLWAKIAWLLACLVAPELVAAVALAQRRNAKSLAKHMNEKLGMQAPPGLISRCRSAASMKYRTFKQFFSKSSGGQVPTFELKRGMDATLPTTNTQLPINGNRKNPWTLKHGFFAGMGGFGLHIPPLPDDIHFLPGKSDEARYIITPEGIKFLARFRDAHKDLPDISVQDIDALSRASAFGKFVVCCQAIWFIVQAILRLAHNMPISLLELNALAHAVCVLLTYLFWWDKPSDVDQPYYLRSRFLHPAAADIRLRISTSSVASLWKEHASLFLDDQETHYRLFSKWVRFPLLPGSPCTNLKDYLRMPRNDYTILRSEQPEQLQGEDFFVRFCNQGSSGTVRPPRIEVSWAKPLPHTGWQLATAVPLRLFKSRSPVLLPGFPYNPWIKLLPALVVQPKPGGRTYFRRMALSTWLLTGLSVFLALQTGALKTQGWVQALIMITTCSPIVALSIIPQARRAFSPKAERKSDKRQYSLFRANSFDGFHIERVAREPCDADAIPPPNDIGRFLAHRDTVLQIKASDANLLEVAWQNHQISPPYRSLNLITPMRLGEMSGLRLSGYILQDLWLLVPFLVSTAIYGSIHFIGVEAIFRSETEKTLWNVSTLILTTGLAIAGLVFYPLTWLGRQHLNWFNAAFNNNPVHPHPVLKWVSKLGLKAVSASLIMGELFLLCPWPLAYLAARWFLLVESFIALTHQPRAVYEVRPWAAYWPHIS